MPKIGIENLQPNLVNLLLNSEDLSRLETDNKNSLVDAINELVLWNKDEVDELSEYYKNQLKQIFDDKGIVIEGNESVEELIDKLNDGVISKNVFPEWSGVVDNGIWITAGNMNTNRRELTSSIVNNKIYCIGGYTGNNSNKNECYDVITNIWETKTNMTTARYQLSSSVVDNKIYCIGGNNGSDLNKNECYDPSTNSWSTKANMSTARRAFTSSVVDDKIYCIGGYSSGNLNKNECYNPITNTWSTKANMTTARHSLSSSVINNKIYCIGGDNGSYLNTNECYVVFE